MSHKPKYHKKGQIFSKVFLPLRKEGQKYEIEEQGEEI